MGRNSKKKINVERNNRIREKLLILSGETGISADISLTV
jgi:hypothetical protein